MLPTPVPTTSLTPAFQTCPLRAPRCSLIHHRRCPPLSLSTLRSLSPCRVSRPGNEGPLCPVCLSCVPWCSGAQLDKSQTAAALFAHYSHYLASNQRRTGRWDLSTTHKGPGSLVGPPASASIRKGVHRGGGSRIGAPVQYQSPSGVYTNVTYFAYGERHPRRKVWFSWCFLQELERNKVFQDPNVAVGW